MNRAENHSLSHPITVFVWELLVRPSRGSFEIITPHKHLAIIIQKGFAAISRIIWGWPMPKGVGKYNNLQPFHSVALRLGYLVQLEVLY